MSRGGHTAVIQVLVAFGADVNETGKGGTPAVVSAASGGHLECVILLINDMGCDLNAQDLYGQSALHASVKLKEPVQCIHMLLRSGIDTKITDQKGLTALQLALQLTNIPALEVIQILPVLLFRSYLIPIFM